MIKHICWSIGGTVFLLFSNPFLFCLWDAWPVMVPQFDSNLELLWLQESVAA
jgi:hypothetical protein